MLNQLLVSGEPVPAQRRRRQPYEQSYTTYENNQPPSYLNVTSRAANQPPSYLQSINMGSSATLTAKNGQQLLAPSATIDLTSCVGDGSVNNRNNVVPQQHQLNLNGSSGDTVNGASYTQINNRATDVSSTRRNDVHNSKNRSMISSLIADGHQRVHIRQRDNMATTNQQQTKTPLLDSIVRKSLSEEADRPLTMPENPVIRKTYFDDYLCEKRIGSFQRISHHQFSVENERILLESFLRFPYPDQHELKRVNRLIKPPVHFQDQLRSWFSEKRLKVGISWCKDEIDFVLNQKMKHEATAAPNGVGGTSLSTNQAGQQCPVGNGSDGNGFSVITHERGSGAVIQQNVQLSTQKSQSDLRNGVNVLQNRPNPVQTRQSPVQNIPNMDHRAPTIPNRVQNVSNTAKCSQTWWPNTANRVLVGDVQTPAHSATNS